MEYFMNNCGSKSTYSYWS